MANITTELAKFRSAAYGEDVRGSMISAIVKMNEEAGHAEEWATGGTGETPSATNNAMYYAGQADARARAWGDGTTPEGEPIPDTDPAYGISAKDWADAAAASAATLELDATLESATKAAQAKAAGDGIRVAQSIIDELFTKTTDLTSAYMGTGNGYIKTGGTSVNIGDTISLTPTTATGSGYKYFYTTCKAGDSFTVYGKAGAAPQLWAFTDASLKLLNRIGTTGSVIIAEADAVTVQAQTDGYFISNIKTNDDPAVPYGLSSHTHAVPVDATLQTPGMAADAAATGHIADVVDGLFLHSGDRTALYDPSHYIKTNVSFGGTVDLTHLTAASYKCISLPCMAGDQFTLYGKGGDGARLWAFTDKVCKMISVATASEEHSQQSPLTLTAAQDGYFISNFYSSVSCGLTVRQYAMPDSPAVLFVSPSGNDENDGTTAGTPMLTINAAIAAGAKTVSLAGGVYTQTISLASVKDRIRFVPTDKDKMPLLINPNALLGEAETAVSGYTKVYSMPCEVTFGAQELQIFQDGVPDEDTEIDDAERHPLQRGKPYRCDDTVIWKASADNLSGALTEIEAASGYKWFLDTANETLYYSRPQAVSSAHPLMRCGTGFSVFTGTRREIQLEAVGIFAKYQKFDLSELAGAVLTDCSCGNVNGPAAFMWDSSVSIRLYRCEAYRVCYTASTGDGFNAHSVNTNDAFAKQTTAILTDCWAHDVLDDGYSDHERCETSIFGGLYEYNGAGVTPAVGSHCTCYNVYSRFNKNEADFYYAGDPAEAEGGVGGQIACFGCVAEGKGSGYGFRLSGSTLFGMFVNCIAINRATGFSAGSSAGRLINCSTHNVTTPKSGTFTVINATPVPAE